jgi:hypothetical protein
METLEKMKILMEKISIDTHKLFNKGNFSASKRARKNTQELRDLIVAYRKEVLNEGKKQLLLKKIKKGK